MVLVPASPPARTVADARGLSQRFRWPRARCPASGAVVVAHRLNAVSEIAIHATTASEKPPFERESRIRVSRSGHCRDVRTGRIADNKKPSGAAGSGGSVREADCRSAVRQDRSHEPCVRNRLAGSHSKCRLGFRSDTALLGSWCLSRMEVLARPRDIRPQPADVKCAREIAWGRRTTCQITSASMDFASARSLPGSMSVAIMASIARRA